MHRVTLFAWVGWEQLPRLHRIISSCLGLIRELLMDLEVHSWRSDSVWRAGGMVIVQSLATWGIQEISNLRVPPRPTMLWKSPFTGVILKSASGPGNPGSVPPLGVELGRGWD